MKGAFADVSSVVPGLTVWALLALLWPGKAPPPCSRLRRARGSPSHSRGSGTDLPQSLRRDINKGQKGKLRNNEHLSNLSLRISPLLESAWRYGAI